MYMGTIKYIYKVPSDDFLLCTYIYACMHIYVYQCSNAFVYVCMQVYIYIYIYISLRKKPKIG